MKNWQYNLAKELKQRDNPTNIFDTGIKAIVINLDPLTVSILNGQIILTENYNLIFSEWFVKRLEIDKTQALSVDVINLLATVSAVENSISDASAKTAVIALRQAVDKINTELLQLKLDLSVGDTVILVPSAEEDKFFVIDKI